MDWPITSHNPKYGHYITIVTSWEKKSQTWQEKYERFYLSMNSYEWIWLSLIQIIEHWTLKLYNRGCKNAPSYKDAEITKVLEQYWNVIC